MKIYMISLYKGLYTVSYAGKNGIIRKELHGLKYEQLTARQKEFIRRPYTMQVFDTCIWKW